MKSLFNTIDELNLADDFSVHFAYLNLIDGWAMIDELPCDTDVKNRLVKYINHAYNPDSPLFRSKKDRLETKLNAIKSVGLHTDKFILECVYNKNKKFNDYIWWYIRQLKDREFAIRIGLEETMMKLLQMASEGIESYFNIDNIKELTTALQIFKKMEISLSADSMDKAMKLKDRLDSIDKKLEVKFQHLKSVATKEIPEVVDDEGWLEFEVFSRKQNDS